VRVPQEESAMTPTSRRWIKPLPAARRQAPLRRTAAPGMERLEDRCVPAILHMGAGETYTTLSQVAAAAQNGDDIQIDAGTYSGQYATFTQSNLTIEGVGGIAHFDDTGTAISNRKGIFVIDGSNTTVRNIEFSGAHDSAGLDANWAGIRQEGATLTVDHCYFHNNDDGILTSAGSTSDILIKYSEFAHNGYGDGQSHNMYIGNVRSFTLEYSYTHDANVGHDVKSRANTNYILYNWIGDTGTGSASYELTMPNGGTAYIIGNIIRQDPDTQNSTIVDWGSEGAINPTQGVFIVNNTIINDRSGGTYIRLNGSGMPVELINNIFGGSGGGTVYSGPAAQQTTNLTAANPGFANPSSFDYHLTSGSAAIDAGSNPGSANGVSLTPTNQYVAVANTQARPVVGALDIGAFEFGTAPTVPAAPTNLAAAAGNAQVSLSWTASTGATSYNIYRGTTANSLTLLQGTSGTSFTNSGLTNGTTYYYQVTAVNAAGESGKSNQASATPQAPVTVAAAPTNLSATAGNAQVSLTWTGSTGATSYNVYRGTTASSLTLLQGTGGTSLTNSGLTNGTTYYYQVTAVNTAGESGKSNQVSATPVGNPTAVAGFVKVDTTTQGTWTSACGADGYNVSQDSTVKTPSYAQVGFSNQSNYTWASSTTDVRALQKPENLSDRIAGTWYTNGVSNFTIDVNLTDGNTHQVALYALDWDSTSRAETIKVLDAGTGTVLDTRVLSAGSFHNGEYLVWNIKGHVKFEVDYNGGYNAVISGIFFGGPATQAVVGTGTGLMGQYFADQTLSKLVLTRTDATVNFNWGSGSPAASVPVDHFSARWTGQVQAQYSQTYTFYTDSDDGVRLWINGQQIVNNWTDHSPTENSGTITLVAGQKYSIIMEYYEDGGGAVAKLLWSSPSTAKQVVPTSQLYAAAAPVVAVSAGGPATGAYLADGFFTGGGTSSVTNAINTSGVINPAPQSVYQTWRYGNFTYTMPNLTPGRTYTVRLDFSENVATAAGQRVFNVGINGTQVLTNFDIFATAGGAFTALTEQFTAVANSSGQIVIQFTTVVGNARVSGIEIY
jgi:hypothetical protein